MVGRNRGSGNKGLPDVGRGQAKAAGVYGFGGAIDESVPPAPVSADGTVAEWTAAFAHHAFDSGSRAWRFALERLAALTETSRS